MQGINLYYKIVKVYGAERSRILYFLTIGWGIPAPIVIITGAVRWKTYSSINRYKLYIYKTCGGEPTRVQRIKICGEAGF